MYTQEVAEGESDYFLEVQTNFDEALSVDS